MQTFVKLGRQMSAFDPFLPLTEWFDGHVDQQSRVVPADNPVATIFICENSSADFRVSFGFIANFAVPEAIRAVRFGVVRVTDVMPVPLEMLRSAHVARAIVGFDNPASSKQAFQLARSEPAILRGCGCLRRCIHGRSNEERSYCEDTEHRARV